MRIEMMIRLAVGWKMDGNWEGVGRDLFVFCFRQLQSVFLFVYHHHMCSVIDFERATAEKHEVTEREMGERGKGKGKEKKSASMAKEAK